jgi:uncharacterized membrane protein YeaQ/YmgE (transglycosylase-associated protein family)
MLNFIVAIGIGLVVGIIGGIILRSRSANAVWLAPVLAIVGAVAASVLALIFGEPTLGWREITLQCVLAVAGVAVTYFVGGRVSGKAAAPTT